MTAVEHVVARILFWGGAASVVVMLTGLTGYAVEAGIRGEVFEIPRAMPQRQTGQAVIVFTSVPQVLVGLRQRPVDPLAVAAVGILGLFATPVVAVASAVPFFLAESDRRYFLIALALAGALIGSLVVGGG